MITAVVLFPFATLKLPELQSRNRKPPLPTIPFDIRLQPCSLHLYGKYESVS